jgi:hypothetical protein
MTAIATIRIISINTYAEALPDPTMRVCGAGTCKR